MSESGLQGTSWVSSSLGCNFCDATISSIQPQDVCIIDKICNYSPFLIGGDELNPRLFMW